MTLLVNAHTHLYSGLAAFGMPPLAPEPSHFVEILERLWWRLDRALDANILRASARSYVAKAIRAGTRALVDHHESPAMIEGSLDILAEVCEEFRMPTLLCYGATERNGGREEARRGLAECRRFIEGSATEGVRGLVGLHASFTVSDDTIREAADLARELDTALHLHVAEDRADVRDAQQRGFAGVLDRLESLNALVPNSIFAHGVHLTREEVARCEAARCWLVQNPRSNANNRVGFAAQLGASQRVALGTDGFESAMEDECRALIDEGLAKGVDPDQARARLRAGQILARESWPAKVLEEGPRAVSDEELEDIEADAKEQASRLWERMATLVDAQRTEESS